MLKYQLQFHVAPVISVLKYVCLTMTSWLFAVTPVYHFTALSHINNMKLLHKAAVNIVAEDTTRLDSLGSSNNAQFAPEEYYL